MKRTCYANTFIAAVFLASLSLSLSGCRPERVASVWFAPLSAEQDQPDWLNLAAYRLDPLNGIMTIANDSSTLYVRFLSRDPRLLRRLERNGLIVWLSGSGAKTERLGVHYPLGFQKGGAPFHPDRFLPDAKLSPEAMSDLLTIQNDEFEITLGDSTIRNSHSEGDMERVGVGALLAQTQEGSLEYTLRIREGELVPWIKPGARVTMEVESAAMERPRMKDRDGDEGFRDRMPERPSGGRGGRPGGGMRGGHRGERGDETPGGIPPNKPIHFRFEIQLAESALAVR
jgi:hypothetical protein